VTWIIARRKLPRVHSLDAHAIKILVPFDGTLASLRALKLAIEQVKRQSSGSLLIINVQNLATAGLADGAGIMPPSWIVQEETQIGREVVKEPAAICEVSTTASLWSVVASPPPSTACG